MSTKRLFVALPLPDALRTMVRQWSQQLQTELPFQKWVHPADYHITLKFLGDTSIDSIIQIKEELHFASAGIKPFQLKLEGLGCFGSHLAPSIIWVGIQGDILDLRQLHQSVESAMATAGFAMEERSFHPHLSLARRFRRNTKMNWNILPSLAERLETGSLSWQVDQIALYASRLGHDPMYEAIDMFQLSTYD